MIGAEEPPAEVRAFAGMVRQTYVAFRQAGFSQDQALELSIVVLELNTGIAGGDHP